MSAAAPTLESRQSPIERLKLLEQLGDRRLTGTPIEKRAQEVLGEEVAALGFRLDWRPFTWTQSLYAGLLLHFGLAALATGIGVSQPFLGAALHLLVALSYTLESTRKAILLRSLFPSIQSQNLLATLPARRPLRKRIVLIAHTDAAYTGFLFTPALIKLATKEPPAGLGWLKKQLGTATALVALLGVLELVSGAGLWTAPVWLRGVMSVPAVLIFVLNLDVVLRNRIVPGAADNLSGCTGSAELAHRLVGRLPDDVELVIVFSGAEEAGTGGAMRLAEAVTRNHEWSPKDTIVLGLDTLSNGTLRLLEEGELWRMPLPAVLVDAVDAENRAAPSKPPVSIYVVPTGATDALPFLTRGFPAGSLTCIDPEIGAPRHYHHPSDTWRNVDVEQLEASIDFAERLILRLAS